MLGMAWAKQILPAQACNAARVRGLAPGMSEPQDPDRDREASEILADAVAGRLRARGRGDAAAPGQQHADQQQAPDPHHVISSWKAAPRSGALTPDAMPSCSIGTATRLKPFRPGTSSVAGLLVRDRPLETARESRGAVDLGGDPGAVIGLGDYEVVARLQVHPGPGAGAEVVGRGGVVQAASGVAGVRRRRNGTASDNRGASG
jgi:hypothetical protein